MTFREMEERIGDLEMSLIRMTTEREGAQASADAVHLVASTLTAENARLRAAIAPTPENAEALAEALYRKWYADDWTECKTSDPATAGMCRQGALVFLAAIAARAGIKP